MSLSRITLILSVTLSAILSGTLLFHNYLPYGSLSLLSWHTFVATPAAKPFSWETLAPSKSLEWQICYYPDRECARLIVLGVPHLVPRSSKTDVERALWEQGLKGLGVVNNSREGIAHNTARDMLSIVEVFGRNKIQYWGFSYGSILRATFAAMFPDKVERLVIDGVVDAENYYSSPLDNNLQGTDVVLESFFTGCAKAGPSRCAFWAPTAEDIRKNLDASYDLIRSKPVPVLTGSGYGMVDYSSLRGAVFAALYSPYSMFQTLATGLAMLGYIGDRSIIFNMVNAPPYTCSCNPSEPSYNNLRDDILGDLESSQDYFERLSNTSNWADICAGVRLSCTGWPEFPKDHF
ncbi:hypothetical protein CPB84DRAFT_1844791 [Gymnopilus junonius]|uniref:AB hydrolase-1 domain-containing protein n=1 Tax=Gymnopilus junonius TaxID=109634 RepID=A0A9P5NR68_GYMJU|nr:hypothetical protein CPB84DRAFT_1844791 [Gymnopilus junonius]